MNLDAPRDPPVESGNPVPGGTPFGWLIWKPQGDVLQELQG